MANFSLFLGAKSFEVPSVILLPWKQLKIQRTGLTCKMCLKGVSLKQLDTLSRFGMVEEKQEGGAYFAHPPGKIEVKIQNDSHKENVVS